MNTATFSRKELQERCKTVESELISAGRRKSAEFETLRPKGREARSVRSWFVYLLNLTRDAGAARAHEGSAVITAEMEREILDALRNKPEVVELATPLKTVDESGEETMITHLAVHQKSTTALMEMHYWDIELEKLGTYVVLLRESTEAKDLALLRACLERIEYLQRVLVWIVTTGREGIPAMCPYPKDVVTPAPPAHFDRIDVVDVGRILSAHIRVNFRRLRELAVLTRVASTSHQSAFTARPSWSLFISQLSDDLNISEEEMIDRWSMTATIAKAALKLRAQHEARLMAERERAKKSA